jgi:indolepyruvate ferredoxin oxidoreductase
MLPAFNLLQKGKFLRNTPFDIFGYSEERKTERRLIAEYLTTIETLAAKLTADNLALAVEIAEIPDEIRGFGYIKDANVAKADIKRKSLLEKFAAPATPAAPQMIAAE